MTATLNSWKSVSNWISVWKKGAGFEIVGRVEAFLSSTSSAKLQHCSLVYSCESSSLDSEGKI